MDPRVKPAGDGGGWARAGSNDRDALNWLVPLPFQPANLPAGWLGATLVWTH
jgi:hypothetical protein